MTTGPSIAIRADSGVGIGSGHVMRCLTLASELRRRGVDVAFVMRERMGDLGALVAAQGFRVHRLPADEAAPAGAVEAAWSDERSDADADATLAVLEASQRAFGWIVADHYGIGERWERRVRRIAPRVVVVDDLANRRHDCDLLLDQNLADDHESRYQGLVPSTCRLLLGPRYALIREALRQQRPVPLDEREGRVLVYFGPADGHNMTGVTLEALARLERPPVQIDVLLGKGHPFGRDVAEVAGSMPNVRLLEHVDDVGELMARAELAIGAGGSTNWERCLLGLPAIVVSIAPNQEVPSRALAERGAVAYLGPSETATVEDLHLTIAALRRLPQLRCAMATAGRAIVDGRGCTRVADALARPLVRMRLATAQDAAPTYEWRNAPETRRYMFDASPISWESHRRWHDRAIADPHRIILVAEEERPFGVVRFDTTGAVAVVSIYMAPSARGRGLGAAMIEGGLAWLRQHRPDLAEVRAEVLDANEASHLAFARAGFTRVHATYSFQLRPHQAEDATTTEEVRP